MNNMSVVSMAQQNSMQALVPRNLPEALELAEVLAKSSFIPDHLKGKPSDCLLIIMQAQRWGMDAMNVASCTSIVSGKLCYEGKLVAAALYSMGAVDGRLRYEFSGVGTKRAVKVIGKPRGLDHEQTVDGTVENWKTNNGNWTKSPDDMLVYRGTRQWARRYAPEALLGVYTPDEMEETETRTTVRQVDDRPGRSEYPPADFDANLSKWGAAIESGRRSADEIIAMVTSKGTLTDEQIKAIRSFALVMEGDFIPNGENA